MESQSSPTIEIIKDQLQHIISAIDTLREWNNSIETADCYLESPEGMKTLAASCMLLEAIGEGVKKIDKKTNHQLLPIRSEMPWKQVMGIRDHIVHGYFDINADLIFDVVKNDLDDLREAIIFFSNNIYALEF